MNADLIDLRPITDCRHGSVVVSVNGHIWLKAGIADLRKYGKGKWSLRALLKDGATDFEHSRASAFSLPLIGVEFAEIEWRNTNFTGFIDSRDWGEFHIPATSGYDPLKDAKMCREKSCHKHLIVAEDLYLGPKPDMALFRMLAGRRVEITFISGRDAKDK